MTGEESTVAPVPVVPQLLTVREAASLLHVADQAVRELIYAGAFDHLRIGRRLMVVQSSLVEWIETSKRRGMAVTGTPEHVEVVALHGRRKQGVA